MRTAKAILLIARPDTTILAFLAVLLPAAAKTGDIQASLKIALPVLFIVASIFILNDIDDVESDKINHPNRPLPSGDLLPRFVTGVYFVLLATALFTTKVFVRSELSFLYYALLVLGINYKYVGEHFPNFKAFYVACASSSPIFIAARVLGSSRSAYLIGFATVLFILGRELVLDHDDLAGDPASFISHLSKKTVAVYAFALQSVALILLSALVKDRLDFLVLCGIAILSPASFFLWLTGERARWAKQIMKIQMYGGLYFML